MKLFSLPLITLLFVNVLLYAQAPTTWVVGTQYNSGSIVGYEDNFYRAIQDVPGSVGGTPDTLTDYWVDIFSTKPTVDPEDPPTTEPDTSDSDLGNLTPPEDNATQNTKIVRLSVRGHIGDADDERFMAFNVISPTEVLVRAIGPALGDLSSDLAPVALIDPTLLLIDEDGNDIDGFGNDNYVSSSQKDNILNLCQTLYPAIPIKEVESASINTFNAGTFYANVRDLDYLQTYGSRIGWVAVDMTDSSSSGGFSGVSCRGIVKPADGAMYAAFEIVGEPSDRRKIFIRGRGKSLSEFGVSDTLSNIMLSVNKFNTVTDETTFIRDSKTYTDEVNADEIRQESIDYFPEHLIPLDPSDPGILVELEPGYYSVDIESEDGESGVAWLGIDDVTD